MTNLEERLEQGLAPAWRPDGDDPPVLVGEVVGIDTADSEYSDQPYIILTVRQDSGEEKAVHAFHTVLRNELIRAKPQPGERIGIKYLGEQKSAGRSKYDKFIGYVVRMDRQATAFNWATLGAPSEEPDVWEEQKQKAPEQEVKAPASAGKDDIPFN